MFGPDIKDPGNHTIYQPPVNSERNGTFEASYGTWESDVNGYVVADVRSLNPVIRPLQMRNVLTV